jgi:N-acetylglucosamine kinase-like BadF-type ATPase
MNHQVVIGVDGGGTRLRVALVAVDGALIGTGEAGSGNYHDVGADIVRANLAQAIAAAWADAGMPAQPVCAVFLGLGSIVTPEDRATIHNLVQDLEIVAADRIGVDHDLRIAHMGGLAGAAGVVLIAGTGSSCYGRDAQGRTGLAGGWGPTLDDPGSSFWLGRQAMIAAIRAFDGRGPATKLSKLVTDALELPGLRHILRAVELQGLARSEVAALARLVTTAATEGDAVAVAIMQRGAQELALMVRAVTKQVEGLASSGRIPVVVTGGLTSAGSIFLDPLDQALAEIVPQAQLQAAVLPPVLGAALLAMELAGEPYSLAVINRLASADSRPEPVGAAR